LVLHNVILWHVDLLLGNNYEISSDIQLLLSNGFVNNGLCYVIAIRETHGTTEKLLEVCYQCGLCQGNIMMAIALFLLVIIFKFSMNPITSAIPVYNYTYRRQYCLQFRVLKHCSSQAILLYCIVLYCIYSAFKTSMRRIQNIVNIQHTDNNKYINTKYNNWN
jgi:hypothetical protein